MKNEQLVIGDHTIKIIALGSNVEDIKFTINDKELNCKTKNNSGHYEIRYGNKRYNLAKVIYLLSNGLKWEDNIKKRIIYIDGNSENLLLSNIKITTMKEIMRKKHQCKITMHPDELVFNSITATAEWLWTNTKTKQSASAIASSISRFLNKTKVKGYTTKSVLGKTFTKEKL